MRHDYLKQKPKIAGSAFCAAGTHVIGAVEIGEQSSVWFNTVIRADIAPIHIGHHTNIQDGSVLHVDENVPVRIGNHVTIGHNAIVHSSVIEDHVLIGMGAIVLSNSKIGKEAMIAAGALVKEGFEVPPQSLVVGIPGKVIRQLTDEELAANRENATHYVELAATYRSRMPK